MTALALIIDDEADIRELIALTLKRMGLEFHAAANLEEARKLLNQHKFDLCLTDMLLPDGSGVDFVKHVQKTQTDLPIAVITAHGNMRAAVDAMKNGAYDFVSKPVDINQLRQLVIQAISLKEKRYHAANEETHSTTIASAQHNSSTNFSTPIKLAPDPHTPIQLIGNSPPVNQLHNLINKVSRTNAPIWITGEPGTGKELIARLIHEQGPRNNGPFVAVNCGAIPANLIEGELFGYTKDGFAGASSDYQGLIKQANGGTLFLDDVAQLPLQIQVKLLKTIQERSLRSLGAQQASLVDVRILSASLEKLNEEVDAGRFRHDLYYRLNVIALRAPSLREKYQDIPLLVDHLLIKLAQVLQCSPIRIDALALEKLQNYNYPGNVPELENLLERATTMMDHGVIKAGDIDLPDKNNPLNISISSGVQECNLGVDSEHQRILDALNTTHWNRKAAAKLLGLTYRQLRYRIQQLNIENSQ